MGISTPFGKGSGEGVYNPMDWLIGKPMTDDMSETFSPSFNYEGAPEVDAGAYQLGNEYATEGERQAAEQQARESAQMQGAQIATGPQDQMREGQVGLQDMLRARAEGTAGLSIAELQMRRGLQEGQAGAASLAASQAGVNPAMAARQAQMAQQGMAMQTNQQASQLRAQEIIAAQGLLGQQMGATRAADIGLATGQAGFDQSTGQANLSAEQNQAQMNDQMSQFYESQAAAKDQAQLEAQQEQQRLEQERAKTELAAAEARAEDERTSKGGMVSAAGTVLSAFSDVNAKQCIDRSPEAIDDFMNSLAAYEYEYKDEIKDKPLAGRGKILSVMAQDAERTELGKEFVEDDEATGMKKMNYGKGLGTMLASIARLNERLGNVEGDDK